MQTIDSNFQLEGQMTIFDFIPDSGCGKTCQEPLAQTPVKILGQSLKKSQKSANQRFLFLDLTANGVMRGMWKEMDGASLGVSETQLQKECHREEEDSFLWRILEEDAPEKYYLSATACLGILRRCGRRGKELPSLLRNALLKQADTSEEELIRTLTEA